MDSPFTQKPLLNLYDRLTRLYPLEFREKFSAEQREVFEQSLADAIQTGRSPFKLILREVSGLPTALANLYLAALRAGGWKSLLEFFALALIFILPSLSTYRDIIDPTALRWTAAILSNILTLALVAGVFLGLPRWYLPYAGFVLAFLLLIATLAILQAAGPLAGEQVAADLPLAGRLVYTVELEGILDMALLALVALGALLARPFINLFKLSQSKLFTHQRRWSDVSFLLYGSAILSAVLTFERYRYIEGLSLIAVLILVAGAWRYLRAATPARGLVTLLTAVVLAFTLTALGKWFLLPLQEWPGWFETHPLPQERWYEAGATLIDMLWLCVLIAAPAAWRWLAHHLPARLPRRQPAPRP